MSKKENKMFGNIIVDNVVSKAEPVVVVESTPEPAPVINPHNLKHAYSLIENEGKYHVVSVEFDPNTLVPGKVKKVESNTNKYLMQERLQVLMMGDDYI